MSNDEEYADTAAELVKLRREAKLNGNFFVEPEASRVAVSKHWLMQFPFFREL